MQLRELQEAFAHALLTRDAAAITPYIQEGDVVVTERLGIYRANVFGALAEALKDTFPAVTALVGEAFFEQMATHFIQKMPPRAACLLWYGADFPRFIADYPAAAELPYLADVAQFEWAWHSALFAPDDTPLDAAWLLAQEEPELASLHVQPRHSLALVRSMYPLEDIWHYARQQGAVAPPDMTQKQMRYWLIWRPEQEVLSHPLQGAEYAALEQLVAGATLPQLLAASAQHSTETDGVDLLALVFKFQLLRALGHSDTLARGE